MMVQFRLLLMQPLKSLLSFNQHHLLDLTLSTLQLVLKLTNVQFLLRLLPRGISSLYFVEVRSSHSHRVSFFVRCIFA
jgi:hypothetical protein